MPKTRMNSSDREKIAKAIIAHKWDVVQQELAQERQEMGTRLFELVYTPRVRELMTELQKALGHKTFATVAAAKVNAAGQVHTFPLAMKRPVCEKHEYGNLMDLDAKDPLCVQVQGLTERVQATKADREADYRQLLGLLGTFATFDALDAAWQDASAFISPVWRAKGQQTTAIAISFREASVKFGLPPE